MDMVKKYLKVMSSDFRGNWYKLPNILTEIRLLGSFIVAAMLIFGPKDERFQLIITIVFAAIAATDLFDGFFARILHQKTEYGRLLDPIADATLGIFTLIGLCFSDVSLRILTIFIVVRQIHLLWLFSKAEREGIKPQVLIGGKVKTAAVSVAVVLSLIPESFIPNGWAERAVIFATAITICSWIEYWVVLSMVAKK